MGYRELISRIDPKRRLVIQTHNFPDHDAVASAHGLRTLLAMDGIPSVACFGGIIQSPSLEDMIDRLRIEIVPSETVEIDAETQIVLVDSYIGNRNVEDLDGKLVGIVDHHPAPALPSKQADWYSDIRSDIGACSTIVFDYFMERGAELDSRVATALLMGIMMDTAFLTRGVSKSDLHAFSRLFFLGDWELGSSLLNNSISLKDLPVFQEAIATSVVEGDSCFIFIDKPCSIELIAIVADFFLKLREIKFTAVVNASVDGEYRLSVRSEDRARPADYLLQKTLAGIGSGGGHLFMAGGIIPAPRFPGRQALIERFLEAMNAMRVARE